MRISDWSSDVCSSDLADDLRQAWIDIMKRANLNAHHRITREHLSVRDHMSRILRRLGDVRFMEFSELFMERVREGDSVAIVVVHFLAVLELYRESLLDITHAAPHAPTHTPRSYLRAHRSSPGGPDSPQRPF